jgi:hypothetical protein
MVSIFQVSERECVTGVSKQPCSAAYICTLVQHCYTPKLLIDGYLYVVEFN